MGLFERMFQSEKPHMDTRFPRVPQIRYPVGKPTDIWEIYDSLFSDYLEEMGLVDVDGLVVNQLRKLHCKGVLPIVVDLMATPRALIDIRKTVLNGGPIRGLAVGHEFDIWKPTGYQSEEVEGIEYEPGDLTTKATWNKVKDWLHGDKAHLFMEMGYGGMKFVPHRIDFYQQVLADVWDMTDDDGGVIVFQTPPFSLLSERGISMSFWLSNLANIGIYARSVSQYASRDTRLEYGLLLLQKNSSNKDLPLFCK